MIDLIPSTEEQEVADSIASFLKDNLPVERHRSDKGRRGRYEKDVWREMAELGCFNMTLAESDGGVGMTLAEETLAFREYGRYLVSPAILGTVLAARIAAKLGRTELVEALSGGKRKAGVANGLGATLGASCAGEFQLFDVEAPDLVVTWNESGMALLDASAFGTPEAVNNLDATVKLGFAELSGAKALAWVPVTELPLPQTAALLGAAMLVGIIEGARDMSVSHAQTRVQFGQPIGSFQGVKHKVADMGLAAELAWCQTLYAALALREGLADATFQCVNAKMLAARGAIDSCRATIQVHGGMGFTAELNAHLFLKRAHLLRELDGGQTALQRRLLTLPVGA
jgi:alkylation response protein AidB-like acyl-CoA dehydrogenase